MCGPHTAGGTAPGGCWCSTRVFGIPGIGRTLIGSISKRDYPVVEAIIVLIAVVTLVMNTLVDLLYHKLDKRIEV